MKRALVALALLLLSAALILASGCGAAKDQDTQEDGAGGGPTQTDYDAGLVDGYAQGYDQGYSDGETEEYGPEPDADKDWSAEYTAGFAEGFEDGYEDGYEDAVEVMSSGEKEKAAVEKAMLTLVQENSAPNLEFEIENIVINGDVAVGRAVCTSEALESPYVIMEKGPGGWTAVDFGTGIEPPDWYPY